MSVSRRHKHRSSSNHSDESDEYVKRRRQRDTNHYRESDKSDHYGHKKFREPTKKEFINMRTTGILADETNLYKGIRVKYNEPVEANMPTQRWRLYSFKGTESLPTIHLHRQSGYLIGKLHGVCEIPMDHPSISKQHAVIQFREVDEQVKPYIVDLQSTNGTFINGTKIEPQRYYELMEKDVLKFGFSTREYVLLSENIAEENDDHDS